MLRGGTCLPDRVEVKGALMSQNEGRGTASCPRCGTEFPAGGRFCPACGQLLDVSSAAPQLASAPTTPIAQLVSPVPVYPQASGYGQPPAHGPVPGYPAGYGYAPLRARRNRTPILVGLGLIGLVLVVAAGALLVSTSGGTHATPSPSAIAVGTPTAAPASASPSESQANLPTEIPTGTLGPTGSMSARRSEFSATLLRDGRVLVTGGLQGEGNGDMTLSSAELYDPAIGTFSPTGSMAVPRADHTATLLRDGRVLITGGFGNASAEVYDPAAGTFSQTGSMAIDRVNHTATLLPDGRVLVAGGGADCTPIGCTALASAELYDPATGKFSPTGSMTTARFWHTATLLPDGRVLMVGGFEGKLGDATAQAELYDPKAGTFSPTSSMTDARASQAATLLPDGRVLIAGGEANSHGVLRAELYDPGSGGFSQTSGMFDDHAQAQAALLRDGRVLVAGSSGGAELYDPSTGTFVRIGNTSPARVEGTVTLLSDGRVLIAGGRDSSEEAITSAELYTP
jgi:hypothetical protein